MTRKLLLVDDETDIRKIAALALTRLGGWQVFQAASGPEAIDTATREQPEVILLDVMMPGMDGPSTLDALRKSPATASITVIFLTAKIQPSERERLSTLGAAGIIAKPFDAMRLSDEVAKIVGKR